MLISTSAVQPWAVLAQGCTPQDPSDCADHRGSIFSPNKSSTWQDQGLFSLVSGENYDIHANGDFGFDTISLGLPGSAATAKVDHQIVAGIAAKDFYLANWGIRPASTNLTTLNDPIPSLLNSLRDQSIIPSLSWGFTAGAYYSSLQTKGGLGSLTLGGYDAARFQNSSTNFPMGPDTSRDLLVGVQAISVQDDGKHATLASLLPKPSLAFIDSSVPHLWLPRDACDAFQIAFGLQFNSTLDLYTVNSTQHSALVSQNASVTLTLGSDLTSQPTVNITMPYGAFDLALTSDYPLIAADTAYFPLRRAANASQVTLGRAFLQNAYVIADYERMSFSVHPAVFPSSSAQSLRPIAALSAVSSSSSSGAASSPSGSSGPAVGAIVGATVGTLLAFFAIIAGAFFLWRRALRGDRPVWPFSRLGRGARGAPGRPAGAIEIGSEAKLELDAPDAGRAGVDVFEGEHRAHKGELDATAPAATLARPSPMYVGRLKSELAGSHVPRDRWSGLKSVNRDFVELP